MHLGSVVKSLGWKTQLIIWPLLIQVIVAILLHSRLLEVRLVFFLTVFLLSEMHFGSTFLFFSTSDNRRWFLERRMRTVFLLGALGSAALIAIISIALLLLLASVFSAFHVTRQSVGISKLLGSSQAEASSCNLIYICSALCVSVAGVRFIVGPWVMAKDSSPLNSDILGSTTLYWCLAIAIAIGATAVSGSLPMSNIQRIVVLGGALTYLPYLCFSSQLTGHLVSVAGHWTQYLILQYLVYRPIRESSDDLVPEARDRRSHLKTTTVFFALCLYSLTMSLIWTSQLTVSGTYQPAPLLMIPLLLQIAHYVIDGQIWRFRDPYIKEVIGLRLALIQRSGV